MLTVYSCIVNQHDLRLVVLAAVICAVASFTAINLSKHVARSAGVMRTVWLAVAATSSGFGIWATHFIAMLAFSPGVPSGYNVTLTAASLVAAIVVTALGLATALGTPGLAGRAFGGAIVGGGIVLMHFTGMAGFDVAGHVVWDPVLVGASIALGLALGALALVAGLRGSAGTYGNAIGALLLTAAICSMHFTAMGAASLVPDPGVTVPTSTLPSGWLATFVALATFAIFVLTFAGLALDIRERRQAERESERMRGLANAAVEGLLVHDGDAIVTVNSSLVALVGASEAAVLAMPLAGILPDGEARSDIHSRPNMPVETQLRQADGKTIPVEVIRRPIDFAGRPHGAIAIRDLRTRKQAEHDIAFLAHHDTLTGLANRNSFNRKLDEAVESHRAGRQQLAILCLDLDRFKEVNDLFGHAAGDALLQRVADRVTKLLAPGQLMARLGGDEFAIIVPNLAVPAQAGRLAERVIGALRDESESEAGSIVGSVSTSVGIALFPTDADDRAGLMNHADTALYRAKADGRGVYRFFEASMGLLVRDRRLLEHDLRLAVAREELTLVYQPQARISDQEVIGFEALLRWRHADRGDISPAIFIPIAEESGLILQIGEWVLRTACREAAAWPQPLGIAINVSTVQLHNQHFSRRVQETLQETGLAPERLEIEITETALIQDFDRALATLQQLKALGIRVAMDDFGTGYSSLSNLRAFPFDKIKIDRSFIAAVNRNDEAATIVRAVLGLGRGLGLPVLAEGVETAAELDFLSGELCSEAQGYFLGRPEPIETFRALTHGKVAAPAGRSIA